MDNHSMELRFTSFSMEENSSTEELTVSGYVNEVEKYSHTLGKRKKFKEKIKKGCFERALSNNDDIHFLAEHDSNKILASTRNGSLELKEDDKGLFMTANISPTSFGKDYFQLIKDGILRNMSFGFSVVKDNWRKLNDGTYTREITDLILYEVSVVTDPAYPQSTISARGLTLIEEDVPDDVEIEENKEQVAMDNEVLKEVEETPNVEEVLQEEKKENVEKEEKRNYIYTPWSKTDAMDTALGLIAKCTSLIQYCNENDKELNKNVISKCRDLIIVANEFILNSVAPVEDKVEDKVEEVILKVDERKAEEVIEETRSKDLSEYINRMNSL